MNARCLLGPGDGGFADDVTVPAGGGKRGEASQQPLRTFELETEGAPDLQIVVDRWH